MTTSTRKIGDAKFSTIGYGAMGLSAFYETPLPDEERFRVGAYICIYAYRDSGVVETDFVAHYRSSTP